MTNTVIAVREKLDSAANAVEVLVERGVSRDNISILMSEHTRDAHFPVEPEIAGETGKAKTVSVGVLVAALSFAIAATATGGALLASGPLVAALAALGVGATASRVAGALVALGVAEVDSNELEALLEDDGTLVAVAHDEPVEDTAHQILEFHEPRLIRTMRCSGG